MRNACRSPVHLSFVLSRLTGSRSSFVCRSLFGLQTTVDRMRKKNVVKDGRHLKSDWVAMINCQLQLGGLSIGNHSFRKSFSASISLSFIHLLSLFWDKRRMNRHFLLLRLDRSRRATFLSSRSLPKWINRSRSSFRLSFDSTMTTTTHPPFSWKGPLTRVSFAASNQISINLNWDSKFWFHLPSFHHRCPFE